MLTGGGGQWGGGEHSGRDAFLLTAHRAFLPSTSGQRRKSKHGCVSYIDPPHRPRSSLPRCGMKVNIRYRGCSIRLGRANQPEFCLSPHQSRLLLVDSTHTINRGREDERLGQNLEAELILLARPNTALPQPSTNCFSSLKKRKMRLCLTPDPGKERPLENSIKIMASTNDPISADQPVTHFLVSPLSAITHTGC